VPLRRCRHRRIPSTRHEGRTRTPCLPSRHFSKYGSLSQLPSFFYIDRYAQAWVHNKADVEYLASIAIVVYAGGPLSLATGSKLTDAGVLLASVYGGTEFGAHSAIFDVDAPLEKNPAGKTRSDWQWMQFVDQVNIRWVPQSEGAYELVFMTCPTHRPSVENLPDGEKGYATSDLWEPHPTKPGLWRIIGRSDDVIVLSNGEKIVPIAQEGHIGAHPWVAGAVMFGRGREQPGVLVELHPLHAIRPGDEDAVAKMRNAIWSQVDEANRPAPAFARLFKETVIFTDPTRPLPRAAKGTIVRKQAISLYEADINALYITLDDSSSVRDIPAPLFWTVPHVLTWLTKHATELNEGKCPSLTGDLFEQGFNSLNATFLRIRIVGELRRASDAAAAAAANLIQPNLIFAHPTLVGLAHAIAHIVEAGDESGIAASSGRNIEMMQALIDKYSPFCTTSPLAPVSPSSSGRGTVVLITGTTGRLGAHILAALISDSRIGHIYALNRGSDLQQRQLSAFSAAKLEPLSSTLDAKITLLEGDLSKTDFGLDAYVLDQLRQSVTHVIHSAWRVDFNLTLASFESHISATARLAGFMSDARFLFMSSVSAAQGWRAVHSGPVPEAPLANPMAALGTGYGMSKFVMEEILGKARKARLNTTTLRISQICGSSTSGMWNTAEWVPSVVKSSIAVECFPAMNGVASWIPMDKTAEIVKDMIFCENNPALANVVHPRPITADEVFSAIRDEIAPGLPIVPLTDWLDRISQASAKQTSEQLLETIPALKLLDFFRGMTRSGEDDIAIQTAHPYDCEVGGLPRFRTVEAEGVSPVLRSLTPLGREDVKAWVAYWREQRFIS